MAKTFLSCVVALTVVSLGLASSDGAPAPRGAGAPIRLRAAQFVPSAGLPVLPSQLRHGRLAEGEPATWLIQFAGPVRSEWKDAVEAEGVELLDYLPDFSFKVRMTPAQARALGSLAVVSWMGPFEPAYKLSPRLRRDGEGLYVVRLERGANGPRAAAEIGRLGSRVRVRQGRTLVVSADSARLDSLARLQDVAWIENFVLREKHNEYGGGQIMNAALAWAGGYDGSTQIVAVADTGIGGGTAASAHPDIPASRIAGIFNWPGSPDSCFGTIIDDGAADVDSGHGTHTSGSALSDGDAALKGKGTAPGAHLVFQAIENYALMSALCQLYGYPDGYYLTGIPADLRQLFQQAYTAGARVHSNSWGADVAGQYTSDSANADDFVWNHRDMVVTFSAGNAGTDANGDGGVDGGSIGSPATAKNVIAVGATENDRASDYECDAGAYAVCDFQGGQNQVFTYWEAWPFDFPAEPLKSDPSAGNPEQLAAFSSRGPADDGRLKPDVVAPGTWVLSGYSDLYQEAYDVAANPQTGLYQYDGWGFPNGDVYKYMGGTSMSNALVAGAAAVVRDFYEVYHSHPASAALVKATLVNSAVDLLDENNDGLDDNAMGIPNVYEGWGRIDLAGATDGSRLFRDEQESLQTATSTTVAYDVAAGTPFRVTLAWTDYPASESAFRALVNDLDLEVSGPGGLLYRGNVFGLGWSAEGGLPDRVNNLENVFVQAPAEGEWAVTVRGYNVPQGPQPFTLVIGGQVSEPSGTDTPPVVGLTSPLDGASVSGTVTVSADASDDDGITQVEFFVDGASLGVVTVAPYMVSWDTTSASPGAHTVTASATDTGSQNTQDSVSVTVDNVVDDPPTITLTNPAAGATVSGTVMVSADASDDDGVTQVEFFVDGASLGVVTVAPYTVSWDTTSASPGAHTVTASATDTGSQNTQDSVSVTVDNVVATSLHVADLDGAGTPHSRRRWRATVTIAVHDDLDQPVVGATVEASWQAGKSKSCVTDASGHCAVTRAFNLRQASVVWTIAAVTHPGLPYDPTANGDPDGDSDGTQITVWRP